MKDTKRSLAIALSLCLCTLYLIPLPSQAAAPIHWAIPSIESLQGSKLLLDAKTDVKTLNSVLSEALFDKWLYQILDLPAVSNTTSGSVLTLTRSSAAEKIYAALIPTVNQVSKDASASIDKALLTSKDPQAWVQAARIMKGYPNGEFKPNEKVTYGQGVVIMKNIKDFLTLHKELNIHLDQDHDVLQPSSGTVSHSVRINNLDKVELTLSWGEKKTGGYSIKITHVQVAGSELHVFYTLTSPQPGSMNTQALTYPKDTLTLDLSLKDYQALKVVLKQENKLK